jgi:hypothetical protein
MPRINNRHEALLEALFIQDACNLRAIIRAWAEMQPFVEGIPHRDPLNILMLSKVTSLMVLNASCIGGVSDGDNNDLFSKAYTIAKKEENDEL